MAVLLTRLPRLAVLGVLLWLAHVGAAAASPLALSEDMDNVRLWPAMELLLEPVPADALLADPGAYAFRPVAGPGESIDDLEGSYWVRITVTNPHARTIAWRLHHQNGLAIGVEPRVFAGGTEDRAALRRLPHRSPLFEITTPAGATQQIYVRRSAPERLVFRAAQWRAWSAPAFLAYAQRDAALKGASYGIMFALAAYNLFLFLSLRLRAYGYYVLFALFFALTWMSWEGLLLRAPSLPGPLPRMFEPAFLAALGCIAAAQFARHLMETRRQWRGIDRYLKGLLWLSAVAALIAFVFSWGPPVAAALLLPIASIPVVAGLVWHRGFTPARFLALGSALFTVGAVVLVFLQLSGASVADGPLRTVPVLQVLELLLMSFALADRMKALQQAKGQAEAMARVDSLTGLANRRALLEEGQAELRRARRYQRALSVIMIDLDHFKQINDNHGHAAGDQVLTAFAAQLTANLRAADRVGRLGGEEFALVLPETDAEAARRFAERLRRQVEASPIRLPQAEVRITASLGVATRMADDTELERLLHRADVALYQAKKAGRNRVATEQELVSP